MRLLHVLILSIMIAFSASSQNWSPVSNGNKYHYTCDTTQTIFTLFADSFDVQGNDTLFYMNRIVLPCDTCVDLSGYNSWKPFDRVFLKNQPQFLMRNCYVSDTIILCYSPIGFVLFPTLPVSSSWLYDTLNNVTATISDKVMGSVLGNTDSLCIILLSSGDSIVLSKNFGIVRFPVNGGGYFRLYGIEGNVYIGDRMAGFMDFFNYNVGDSFVYEIYYMTPEPPWDYANYVRVYYSIMSKTEYSDGYEYNIEGYSTCGYGYGSCANPVIINETLCKRDNPNCLFGDYASNNFTYSRLFLNSYSYGFIMSMYDSINYFTVDCFTMTRYKMNDTTYIRSNPTGMNLIETSSTNYHPDILVTFDSHTTSQDDCYDSYFYPCNIFKARENTGITKQCYFQFEAGRFATMLFCRINGDTIINLLVGDEDNKLELIKPEIYPNHAKNSINLSNVSFYKIASFYSTSGKKVKELILEGDQTEVDVSDLTPGLYFVILEGKNKRATLKFMVE